MRIENHPVLGRRTPGRWVTIHMDGVAVQAVEGEPLAVAVMAAGRRALRYTWNEQKAFGLVSRFPRLSALYWRLDILLRIAYRLRRLVPSFVGLSEPRGVFCAQGRCSDCAMTVDGIPNVRSCVTPVRAGMRVKTQTGVGEIGRAR
jgi:hypothetical protein